MRPSLYDAPPAEVDPYADLENCPICGLEACVIHIPPDAEPASKPPTAAGTKTRSPKTSPRRGLDPTFLSDAVEVIAEGKKIAADGIRYTVDGIVPGYGMLGMLVAYAKVGKTTLGQALAAAVAMGLLFLGRATKRVRVLVIAAEDPPEWTAYLARTLTVDRQWLTFYRAPVILNTRGLQAIAETIKDGGYGLVLIASWQAVVRGLLENENDNAGGVRIVSEVKVVAQASGVPWLIDAHSGKGENQDDDADPMMAMRGASAAAGAADYMLSLRYANGAFGTQRRLSGKGRFVTLAPMTIDYDPATGAYTCLGSTKDADTEGTWRLITEMGALDQTPRSITDIARRCGLVPENGRLGGNHRKHLVNALSKRPEVARGEELRRGQKTMCYRFLEVM